MQNRILGSLGPRVLTIALAKITSNQRGWGHLSRGWARRYLPDDRHPGEGGDPMTLIERKQAAPFRLSRERRGFRCESIALAEFREARWSCGASAASLAVRGVVTLALGVRFRHVLALLGLSIPLVAVAVVHVR